MINKFETTFFFGATVSALALAAVIGLQEFSAGPATAPIMKLDTVEIIAERLPATAGHRAPEQVALVR